MGLPQNPFRDESPSKRFPYASRIAASYSANSCGQGLSV